MFAGPNAGTFAGGGGGMTVGFGAGMTVAFGTATGLFLLSGWGGRSRRSACGGTGAVGFGAGFAGARGFSHISPSGMSRATNDGAIRGRSM